MELTKLFYLPILVLLLFTSCKSSSAIITSKNDAEKKEIYNYVIIDDNVVTSDSKIVKNETINSTNKSRKNITSSKFGEKNKGLLEDTDITDRYTIDDDDVSYLVKQLINNAMEYFGVRYRTGGSNSLGMDCSGLIFTTFNIFDIKLPRTSIDLSKKGKILSNSDIRAGDLVFFKTNPRKKQINHVGLVVDVNDDEVKFIHASVQRGVIVSSTKEAYYKKAFVQANRVLN